MTKFKQWLFIFYLCNPISAFASDWLARLDSMGIFLKLETEMGILQSDNFSYTGQAICGKSFNEYSNIYIGFQKSINISSNYRSLLLGADLTLFNLDHFLCTIGLESFIGFDKEISFYPEIEIRYKFGSYPEMGFSISAQEMLHKTDTSWAEDDSTTINIDESNSGTFFYPETELKCGYFIRPVHNQQLHFMVSPIIRNRAIPGEKIVDLGYLTISHLIFLNTHVCFQSDFSFDFPKDHERFRFGFKFAIATY